MAVHDVLDDGQAQPGAALLAARGGVDAIEALGEARQVLGCDTRAVVGDARPHARITDPARRIAADAHLDGAVLAPILDGVLDQVLQHLDDLLAVAANARRIAAHQG